MIACILTKKRKKIDKGFWDLIQNRQPFASQNVAFIHRYKANLRDWLQGAQMCPIQQ